MMKPKRLFNVYVLTLKQGPITKDKQGHKYTIKNWHCFYSVSREKALHYIDCFDCNVIGYTKNKVVSPKVGTQLFGCGMMHKSEFTFCEADPILPHAEWDDANFPNHHHIGIRKGDAFDRKIEHLREAIFKADKNLGIDYICQNRDVFVPEQFIPKGWVQVKEGEIKDGDLVWEVEKPIFGYWRKPYTFESNIIQCTMLFKCMGDPIRDASYTYCHPFVIRRK